ncbi:MAG: V-type ATP synthase subunit D [Candidatus Aminicenantes bacterium]|nr:V-type ATP synthase subunit D [Candidatus Aminicenantes bacterium]
MRLNVNPNRMELMRLRRRLGLAERGHKLLKDKLEELMRQFLENIRRLSELQRRVSQALNKAFLSFALARSGGSLAELEQMIPEGRLVLEAKRKRILNLAVPDFEVRALEVAGADLLNTESEFDIGVKKMREVLPELLEMASLWKAAELLSADIEITRRRVNALEYILIPNLKETIAYISARLDEMERSFQVQLMRVKEILPTH